MYSIGRIAPHTATIGRIATSWPQHLTTVSLLVSGSGRAVPVVGAMDDMASDSEKSGGSLLTSWLEQANGLRFILHNC